MPVADACWHAGSMNTGIEVTDVVSIYLIEAMLAKTVTKTVPHEDTNLLVEFMDGSRILLDRYDLSLIHI